MLIKLKYLAARYGYKTAGPNLISNIVCRAEFAKYRSGGGSGGVFFDLNKESEELLNKFLITKKRRGKSGNTKRDSIERVEEKTVDES